MSFRSSSILYSTLTTLSAIFKSNSLLSKYLKSRRTCLKYPQLLSSLLMCVECLELMVLFFLILLFLRIPQTQVWNYLEISEAGKVQYFNYQHWTWFNKLFTIGISPIRTVAQKWHLYRGPKVTFTMSKILLC